MNTEIDANTDGGESRNVYQIAKYIGAYARLDMYDLEGIQSLQLRN